jgi:hypothetical protein
MRFVLLWYVSFNYFLKVITSVLFLILLLSEWASGNAPFIARNRFDGRAKRLLGHNATLL